MIQLSDLVAQRAPLPNVEAMAHQQRMMATKHFNQLLSKLAQSERLTVNTVVISVAWVTGVVVFRNPAMLHGLGELKPLLPVSSELASTAAEDLMRVMFKTLARLGLSVSPLDVAQQDRTTKASQLTQREVVDKFMPHVDDYAKSNSMSYLDLAQALAMLIAITIYDVRAVIDPHKSAAMAVCGIAQGVGNAVSATT